MLSAVEELTRQAWLLPYVLRVDSVTNFQYSRADGDELIVEDLVENAGGGTASQRDQARHVALSEPFLVGQLLNDSAAVTAVMPLSRCPRSAWMKRRKPSRWPAN